MTYILARLVLAIVELLMILARDQHHKRQSRDAHTRDNDEPLNPEPEKIL